jgi:xylose isomerase
MDTFARGLRNAARITEENAFGELLANRYASWKSDFGQLVREGKATLEDCEKVRNCDSTQKATATETEREER